MTDPHATGSRVANDLGSGECGDCECWDDATCYQRATRSCAAGHDWRWDCDNPRLRCARCGAMQDAHTEEPIPHATTPDGLAVDIVNTLVDAMVDDPAVAVRVPDKSMQDLYWVAHRMLGARLD